MTTGTLKHALFLFFVSMYLAPTTRGRPLECYPHDYDGDVNWCHPDDGSPCNGEEFECSNVSCEYDSCDSASFQESNVLCRSGVQYIFTEEACQKALFERSSAVLIDSPCWNCEFWMSSIQTSMPIDTQRFGVCTCCDDNPDGEESCPSYVPRCTNNGDTSEFCSSVHVERTCKD